MKKMTIGEAVDMCPEEDSQDQQRSKLIAKFVESLTELNIPSRHMALDDPERCPTQMISGMLKARSIEMDPKDILEEMRKERGREGFNIQDVLDGFSPKERAQELAERADNKIADGDYAGALEDLCIALRLDPDNRDYLSLRGVAFYELGRYDEAIADESRSIEIEPNPNVHFNRAEAYYKSGRDKEALLDLRKALDLIQRIPHAIFMLPLIRSLILVIQDKECRREDYHMEPLGFGNSGDPVEYIKTKAWGKRSKTNDTKIDAMQSKVMADHHPVFEGYPYLVARILPAFYHINVLSSELDFEMYHQIAQTQANATKFPICLVMARDEAIYYSHDSMPSASDQPPWGGSLIYGRLRLCIDQPHSDDLLRRERELVAYIQGRNQTGYLTGDLKKGGREATPEERITLRGVQENGLPRGLEVCPVCGDFRGECIDSGRFTEGLVVKVSCYCDNDSLCAYCGHPLHVRKVNANYYNPKDGKIWHTPGFSALNHRCSDLLVHF